MISSDWNLNYYYLKVNHLGLIVTEDISFVANQNNFI